MVTDRYQHMADACVYLMNLPDAQFVPLLAQDRNDGLPPLMNIGVGHDLTIRELAETVKGVVGYQGAIEFDATKPDGTPRKLMDVGRLNTMGWKASTTMQSGLAVAAENWGVFIVGCSRFCKTRPLELRRGLVS